MFLRTRPSIALLIAAANAIPGCGGGGGFAAPAPLALQLSADPVLNGTATITYHLTGEGGGDVLIEYSTDGGATWVGAAPAPLCPSNKERSAPGSYAYLWDTIADGVNGSVRLRARLGDRTAQAASTVSNSNASWLERSASIESSNIVMTYPGVHAGHYDLSPVALAYNQDPAFAPTCAAMGVKQWRISVGRWEIGPVAIMAPEPAAYSTDPAQLRTCSREFYRGASSLAAAQDPANYYFAYLDSAIAAVEAVGATPYLCFDYMPFTLAANQDPLTASNLYAAGDADASFSNGIRTSPPADPAVYAEVVKRTMMHVNGSFANGLGRSIRYVEIGNEPELAHFYTGTQAQFNATYQAVSAALDAQFGASIRIGAGSFAFPQGSTFLGDFLADLGGARLDVLSFHAYDDAAETFFPERITAAKALRDAHAPGAELHCTEWSMNLGNSGAAFGSMAAALHHARALEYFTLLGVSLSHRAVLRDPVPNSLGDITVGPAQMKPAGAVFAAYALLDQTPGLLAFNSIVPAAKPMLLAGRSADALTVVFFHEKPPAGQVGRLTLTLSDPGFSGTYAVDRWLLTAATCANRDGLWHTGTSQASGAYATTIQFTEDTLVVLRLAPTPFVPAVAN